MLACALLADIVASQWNLARNVRGLELRSPGGFCCLAVQAVLCYFASAELLGALGLLHQGSLVLRPRVRVYGLLQVHGHHKSYGSGFIKVAMMGFWCFLGLFIFLFEILSENRLQIVFFSALAPRSGSVAAISVFTARSSVVVCNAAPADRSRWLHQGSLGVQFYSLLQSHGRF